jgi:hypothetical protein
MCRANFERQATLASSTATFLPTSTNIVDLAFNMLISGRIRQAGSLWIFSGVIEALKQREERICLNLLKDMTSSKPMPTGGAADEVRKDLKITSSTCSPQ